MAKFPSQLHFKLPSYGHFGRQLLHLSLCYPYERFELNSNLFTSARPSPSCVVDIWTVNQQVKEITCLCHCLSKQVQVLIKFPTIQSFRNILYLYILHNIVLAVLRKVKLECELCSLVEFSSSWTWGSNTYEFSGQTSSSCSPWQSPMSNKECQEARTQGTSGIFFFLFRF